MPTISVDKYDLFEALGQKYTTEEFEELCFEFGIELDEDTENDDRPIVDGVQEPPQLKIEIPANRYDMLCFEGIALMLNIFRGKQPTPNFRLAQPASGDLETITVLEDTMKVRPLVACAILRNIKFTQKSYDSFISLQDKLHQNLARNRTLVAIGTHDLDTIKGPFTYEARPPKDINFAPLNQSKSMNGEELMAFYEKDRHLGRYLHIIKDKPVYPVIYDSNRVVCSLPPIINGDHSKIKLSSTNIFIECTATDKTKLDIVINMMVTMFSVYAAEPFTIEPVKVISDHNGQTRITPNLSSRTDTVEIDYLNGCLGLSESPESISKLLSKMALSAQPSSEHPNSEIEVTIPPTRADILQRCDVMEDLGIAYGFNRLPRMSVTKTVGAPLQLNKLADIVRLECGMAGWSEVMPLILCSHDENFAWLNRKDDGKTAVRLANPKTAEYQIVRTSLIPGLLKTIRENKGHSVPIRVFETSDVVFKDPTVERRARNERHFAAAWYGKASGFEEVHGLLDRVMAMLRQAFITHDEGLTGKEVDYKVTATPQKRDGYWLEPVDDEPTFFPGRAAAVYARLDGKTARIGEFGILHPTVLENFELKYPVSTLEINLEVFL
ncbi:phenylalanyl-tRNA synthetase beta chain [Annulohypoxylon maeteangense]|uniref:phenylalanyl-tRNA synthetase beta chain n=1 Tax=Annulohypoxylon maeteangense TaxID=1927788 RepID=UPI002008A1E5|nr:phenylalanyl-tRNA synthetase beta chain [Annulohypoxylon maeteangense]KAI0883558.1 phenylalanyl-tRNA synthetase beta chain [Annulohypoxylon maeteangense]